MKFTTTSMLRTQFNFPQCCYLLFQQNTANDSVIHKNSGPGKLWFSDPDILNFLTINLAN